MSYKIARFLANLIVVLGCRLRIVGKTCVPPEGGLVIASNHVGRLDAVFIYHVTNRKDIILLVAEKYRKNPLARWFVKQLNAIWVDRFNADFSALREALSRLKNGGVMVLAPEGTRSASGVLQKARPGVSYLAAKSGAPIVPVALVGSQDFNVVAHLRRLKRPQVTIYVGEPFTLPPVRGKERDAALEEYTDEIMCRIAALLPPEMRGVYADHPRLKELLNMQVVNLSHKFELFSDRWSPKIVGELNGQQVKLAKLKGEFVWHQHENEDELFLVVKGQLRILFRDQEITLREGEFLIVPRGVEHLPIADEEAHVLLLEPAGTLNTGDVRDEHTRETLEHL